MEKGFLLSGQMAKAQYAENKKKMKHPLRSAVTTTGRRMAGARSLWRANGMREEQFGRPVIGIANSFTQLVPGHVHLHEIGQYVKQRIEALGCFAAEFNTIAIDDGIAMGHDGMLYSLPSREIIADSVEYMANAHKVDALVCISNCDKITPGMLMAAMRLDIPTVFVSGGPMEAGHLGERALDLIDAMVMAADDDCSDEQVARVERAACPGCGSCSGMFTANSMNCLTEALGLSLPGNGTVVATHVNRRRLFEEAAALIVRNAERYYFEGDDSVLPRSVATKAAFENAMSLDIAMGGSTNTVLHLLAVAHEAGVDFTMQDIDRLSRRVPVLCKVAPNSHYHIQDVNRAGGILSILGELARGGLLDTSAGRVDGRTLGQAIAAFDLRSETASSEAKQRYLSAPAGLYSRELGTQRNYYDTPDTDRAAGCIRDLEHAYFHVAVHLPRPCTGLRIAGTSHRWHPRRRSAGGRCRHHPLRRPQGRPRDAGDALPHVVPQIQTPRQSLRADYRRPLLGRNVGVVDRSRLARSGFGRGDRRHPHGRRDRDRHPAALDPPHGRRRRNRRAHGRTAAFPPRGTRPPHTRVAKGLCQAGQLGRQRGRTHRRRRIKPDNTMNTNEGQQPGPCITGSQALLESFLREGVDTLFGYPGGAIIPVYDALFDYRDRLRHILVRHEQGAVHAAQGYARVSGRVGVCLVTSGPGATNTVTGLADALMDSTPLVLVTGQVGSSLLGTDAFQETNFVGITQAVTKWNCQVKRTEDIPGAIAKAFYIARSGRPGPVVVDITKDAQCGTAPFRYERLTSIRSYVPAPAPAAECIAEAVRLIDAAQRPLLMAGQGVMLGNAEEELQAFLAKSGIPVASTLLGLSAVPTSSPQYVGMLGMHGNYGPNIRNQECDLLIAVGMRFDDRVTGNPAHFGANAKVIHLEIDPAEIGKIIPADVAVVGDVKRSLPLITERIRKRDHSQWIAGFRACDQIEYEAVIRKAVHPESGRIRMGEVVDTVAHAYDNDAVLVTDVGQQQMFAARYFGFRRSRSLVTSGGLGTMGFGLPAAIGAKLGAPDREVCLFAGDGGLQMTIQELGTIFQSQVAVKIVLLNNSYLGMVRQWQELFYDRRYSFTELANPDFGLIARGNGIAYRCVERREELAGAVAEMKACKGAYLLEVRVESEENVFPMVPAGAPVSAIRLE